MNPYMMGDKQLDFAEFPEVLNDTTTDESGRTKLAFVFGAGRHELAAHVGYITDAVMLPELTTLFSHYKWGEKVPDLYMQSFLDIDLWEDNAMGEYNLFLIGSGKVNLLTKKLMETYGEKLKVRFMYPAAGEIVTDCQARRCIYDYDQTGRDVGMITLMNNPWAAESGKNRVVLLTAGCGPVGTIAAMNLICEFISNRELRRNNKYDTVVPARLVEAEHREYASPEVTRKSGGTTSVYIGNLKHALPLE